MKYGFRAATGLIVATGYVLAGPAVARAADGEDLTCTGERDGGVYASVTVPAGATCVLRNASVQGSVSVPSATGVASASALTLADTTVDGGLDVAATTSGSPAQVNTTSSTVRGAVNLGDGAGTFTDTKLGSLTALGGQFGPVVKLTRSTVGGDVKARGKGSFTAEGSTMDGGVDVTTNGSLRLNNSTVAKASDLYAPALYLCGSHLSTTKVDASYTLRAGDSQDCEGNTFGGDLTVSSLASTVRFYHNSVTGFTSSPDGRADVQGNGNTFTGGVKGVLASLS